jgi:hypothetical protein
VLGINASKRIEGKGWTQFARGSSARGSPEARFGALFLPALVYIMMILQLHAARFGCFWSLPRGSASTRGPRSVPDGDRQNGANQFRSAMARSNAST